jgi:hypothetical protein
MSERDVDSDSLPFEISSMLMIVRTAKMACDFLTDEKRSEYRQARDAAAELVHHSHVIYDALIARRDGREPSANRNAMTAPRSDIPEETRHNVEGPDEHDMCLKCGYSKAERDSLHVRGNTSTRARGVGTMMTDDDVSFMFKKLDVLTATSERTEMLMRDVQTQQVALRHSQERMETRLGRIESRVEDVETRLGNVEKAIRNGK